ncbi:MAG: GNAT family N-acetyltransferase [Cyclobacteriaceae bacterium]
MTSYSPLDKEAKLSFKDQINSSFPIIQAVIDGTQRGMIFGNAKRDFWVVHNAGFSEVFLAGGNANEFVNFVAGNARLPKYFHIYDAAEEIVRAFQCGRPEFSVRERKRCQLVCEKQGDSLQEKLSNGFVLSKVTPENFDSLSGLELDLGKRFWDGKQDFLDNARAIFASNETYKPVSICYAAAVANGKAEIDVFTCEAYRGMGLGKSTTAAFIQTCHKNKLLPNWDCFEDNIGSLTTAKKLNFVQLRKYNFISIFKKEQE